MDNKKCAECGALSTVHLTQIVQDETTVFHLCEECARKKGITISIGDPQAAPAASSNPEKSIVCERCGISLVEFREKGRLGCTGCYDAFEKQLDEFFIQVHGSVLHKGKQYRCQLPNPAQPTDVTHLRRQLDSAVRNEEFELAAAIRDVINTMGTNS